LKGDTIHDHTININNIIIKVEQKTSSLSKAGDFMWQHIAVKHKWNILLLVGIHYNEIKLRTSEVRIKIVNRECGVNIKDNIITITTNEDIIKLVKNV
jgi:hypothetical protein